MRKPLPNLVALALLTALCCFGLSSSALAAGSNQAWWADSLNAKALNTQAEPSLQHIFDSLGYNINVSTDETGIETWCSLPGQNLATIIIEVAGSAATAKSGWYVANDSSVLHQLFNGANGPGDSVSFTITAGDSIGFYMKPGLSGSTTDTWFSQTYMSYDDFNHAKVFRTGVPHEYLIAWEDLPDGGDMDWNDLVIKVRFANQVPVILLPADSTVFQCSPAQICFNITATDANCEGDSLTVTKVSGAGTFTTIHAKGPINTSHCFTPTSAGVYQFVFKVQDIVGATDYDTMNVTVVLNQPPVANAGRDTTLFQCSAAPISIAASCSDPDGNLSTCQLISGTGTYNGTNITFTPAGSGTYTFVIKATDACGATDYDTSVANVSINQPPVANAGRDTTLAQCSPAPISIAASCSDPDGNLSTCQLVSGTGTYDGTNITFTPAGSGTYTFVIKATDACGATDYDTSVANVSINQPPVANAGRDTTLAQCSPAPISIAASCSDPDGNLSTCQLITGTGTYNGTNITFTPAGSGTYTFVIKATDACGATDYDTSVANVSINQPPVANAGRDTTLAQCAPAPISIAASCGDPDGNLSTCQLISGTGTYNGTNITFTPAGSGTYTFVIKATDACGATDYDTSVANVSINQPPVANAGRDTTLAQCAPAPISIAASCSDPDGNLSTCQLISGSGTYNGTNITFTPAGSGTYTFVIKATDACGATDYDTSVANVSINQPPVANAGRDTTLAQCAPAPISIAASCSDPDGNLSTCQLISGTGTYNGTNITFTPAGSGTYTFVIKATDACGATDYDTSVANVSINQPPVANAGRDTTLAQCSPTPISIAASCSDPDGNLSTCQLVSGTGTYDGRNITFTPAGSGTYTFVIKATDACGATDYDTSVANVSINQPPVANAGRDTTIAQCSPAPISIAASCSDPDGNLSTCQLITGTGNYNGTNITFTPAGSGTYTFVIKATDACGATDYDTSVANVSINQPPVANAGRDTTLAQCAPAPISIAANCSDPDGNLSTCQLITGTGTYDGTNITFTPAGSGTYTFVIKATDACGATDYDTSVANVSINQPPVANAGRDTTLFQCAPAQICIPAGCSDADGNLTNCELLQGPGSLGGGNICFTPSATGTYTFIVKATDACGATDFDTSVANVTINQLPVAFAGNDTTLFQCGSSSVCIAASCSDPDGNLTSCQLVSGPGTYNGSSICFQPAASGNYTFVLKATDACGATDFDTSIAHITINQPPVANAGRDTTIFQCSAGPINIAANCSDPDGNLSTCQLISGPGTYDGTNITFTPAGAGTFTFVLRSTDACGATDYDTSVATVALNQPPVANAGRDSTLFVCAAQQICITAGCSDPDNNLTTCELINGPGTLNGSSICFTPAATGTYTFIVKATDACGQTDFDTSVVNVTINQPPVANAGADQVLSCRTPGQPICWNAGATDPDNNLTTTELISGVGTFSSGQICFSPSASGVFSFVIKATDACGAIDYDTAQINVRVNTAPFIAVSSSGTAVFCQQTGIQQVCVPFTYSDAENNVQQITASGPVVPNVTFGGGNGQFCFTPPAGGNFSFNLTVQDSCGLQGQATHQHGIVLVDCDTATCFVIHVQKTEMSLQGHYENVAVSLSGDGAELGGFDFLMAYDASALTAVEVQPGQVLTDCGWEYFTYRFGANGNCNGPCPSGLLRVVAVAETNDGPHHPTCFGPGSGQGDIFVIKFFVCNNRLYECQYVPVTFFTMDCGDNSISSVSGDTLYLDKRIYTFEGQVVWDEYNDAIYPDDQRPFGMGAADSCMLGYKHHPIRCIEFYQGGIDIACSNDIDARGDLNLNGIANEVADAVLYTNYFLKGINAFPLIGREGAIAASDVNADGGTLTVGDLVYLIRVMTGDALPYPKLAPFAQQVNVRFNGSELSTESGVDLGAMVLTFRVDGDYRLTNLSNMTVEENRDGDELRVVVYDLSTKSIAAGVSQILRIEGQAELETAEVSDYQGNMMTPKLTQASLPKEFALKQNYPNPFNPETVIEFALPTASEVSLVVYNVAGQTVTTLVGGSLQAGYHRVTWNGRDANGNSVSSGVYFYKIEAGGFTETRKMLLVK